MPSLTIRNLAPETRDELRRRAAAHGRSMQDEARTILQASLDVQATEDALPRTGAELYKRIRAIVEPIGGIDIELPPRDFARDPPSFD